MGGGGGLGGQPISFPCEWVKSIESAQKKVNSDRELLYIYLHFPTKKDILQGNFYVNKLMMELSQKEAVFVDITINKLMSQEEKDLLKQLKIRRLPQAVITDKHTNHLLHAESQSSEKLKKQLVLAEKKAEKLEKGLDDSFRKACAKCEEMDYSKAADILQDIMALGLKGYRTTKKVDWLYGEINHYMERQLKRIVTADLSGEKKEALIARLQAKVDKDLPAYDNIAATRKNLKKTSFELQKKYARACLHCEKQQYDKALEILTEARQSSRYRLPINRKINALLAEINKRLTETGDLGYAK